eukprot:COSAG02_NODE_9689_length_2140_cov_2.167565_1_plen_150_part_00
MVPNAPLLQVKLFAFAAAAALHIPSSCLGWWDTGHMLTVSIATQRLSNVTVAELNRLVAASESVQSTSPVPSTSLISAGHWPDDVKRRDWDPSKKVIMSPSGLFVAFDAVRVIYSRLPALILDTEASSVHCVCILPAAARLDALRRLSI